MSNIWHSGLLPPPLWNKFFILAFRKSSFLPFYFTSHFFFSGSFSNGMLQGLVLGSLLYLHSILATSLNIYTLMVSKFLSFIQSIPLNSRLDILLPTHYLFLSKYGFGFNLSKAKPLIFLLPQNFYSYSSPTQLMATASVPQARSFGVIYVSFSPSYPIYQNPVDSALNYIQSPNTSPYPHHYHLV